MKQLFPFLIMAAFSCSIMQTAAQEKTPVKFGKISVEDFDLSKHNFDSSVSAVVISDVGSSKFEGNTDGWFTLIFKQEKRVKILNKNGFDAANIRIPLFFDGTDEERITSLKAYTYNVEAGKVVKTELENSSIFKDKISKNLVVKKFTFPAVKEGSIIEYSYTVNSDFMFNLQPWDFQGEYPRLWSEYNVSIPEFFNYVTLAQGYEPFYINTNRNSFEQYNVTVPGGVGANSHVSLRGGVGEFRWVMKEVPALKEEGFTSSLRNHISRIEFQLSQYRFPDQPVKNIIGTWTSLSQSLMEREDFGLNLAKNNNWLDAELKTIVAGASTQLEKASRIYAYVRDNFTCTDHSALYLGSSLKNTFKTKNGSVADINLLLIAMLNHEDIKAIPLLLSTRDHGFANSTYPLMSRFNYVIAYVGFDDNSAIYLDASIPLLGFGKLPFACYNGVARMINKESYAIELVADSLIESKLTTVFMRPDDEGNLQGSFNTVPGYYESLSIREKVKEIGQASYFKKVRSSYTGNIELSEPAVDSIKSLEMPVAIHYDFKIKDMSEDIVYFNPMMSEGFKNNFFKAAVRKYPVEMPYTFDDTYILTMLVPKGFTVDEIPKSAKVDFNDGEGYFEYLISKSDEQVLLRSRLVMKKANFTAEDYNSLREFFGHVVKKHSEQIVLKRKK